MCEAQGLMSREAIETAMAVARMTPAEERMFFDSLRGSALFSEKEIESAYVTTAYFRLLMFPERTAALKAAMAEWMYEDINKRYPKKGRG